MATSKYIIAFFFILFCFLSAPAYAGGVPPDKGNGAGHEPAMHSRVPGNFAPGERRVSEPDPAEGRFLVATRRLKGSIFEESVILLVDYSWHGATGIIINKPTEVSMSDALPGIKELNDKTEKVYMGGPVEMRHINLLIMSDKKPAESKHVIQDTYFSASMNALKEAAGNKENGIKFRVYIGYSGWGPGQLEQEIQRGSWHVIKGDQDILFSETPSLIWRKLIRQRYPLLDTVLREPDCETPVSAL